MSSLRRCDALRKSREIGTSAAPCRRKPRVPTNVRSLSRIHFCPPKLIVKYYLYRQYDILSSKILLSTPVPSLSGLSAEERRYSGRSAEERRSTQGDQLRNRVRGISSG